LDRLVAIKILPPERVGEAKFSDRFATEAAQAVSGLRQVYLELLETHDGGRGGGAQAARKTRALIDSLRSQAQAEQEISRFLQEDHKDRDD
ncbi:MAG: hypothetical protein KC549_12260, partial [Myxococcales bacterium]|nr:hypothetical protein [Myxococcales bacterium]